MPPSPPTSYPRPSGYRAARRSPGYADDPTSEHRTHALALMCLALTVVWFLIPIGFDIDVTPYLGLNGLRDDSFLAVIIQLYPAAFFVLAAAWFWRAHIAAGVCGIQGLCSSVVARSSRPSLWLTDRDPWTLAGLAGLLFAAILVLPDLIGGRWIAVALVVLVAAGIVLFGLHHPDWGGRLVGGLLTVVAGVVAVWLGTTFSSPHWLAIVLLLAVAAGVVGAALAFGAEVRIPAGTEHTPDQVYDLRSGAWSRAYAPVLAAVVLQLAAVARVFATGRELAEGAGGLMIAASLIVSLIGVFTFAAVAGPRRPPGREGRHLLNLYVGWLMLGLAAAGLLWSAAELWDAYTIGTDRVDERSLWIGVVATAVAAILWVAWARPGAGSRGGRPRRSGPVGPVQLLIVAAVLALGLGAPLVAFLANKADRRDFGVPVVLSLTEDGRQIVDAACDGSPTEIRGWVIDPDLDEAAVRLQFANGYCANDPEIVVRQDDIAGATRLGAIGDPPLIPAPRPRAGDPGGVSIDWFMPDRLGVEGGSFTLSDAPAAPVIHPEMLLHDNVVDPPPDLSREGYRVILDARDPDGPADCADARYAWTISAPVGPAGRFETGCRLDTLLPEGRYTITARPEGRDAGPATISIDVEDHLIVALGDSVGSGEGNAPFRDDGSGCNRSDAAGQVRAAQRLEFQDRHSTVTLLHMSCTGGRLALEPREDLGAGNHRSVPWQVGRAAELLGGRKVDAVLISAGANDLGFAKILTKCILEDCRETALDLKGIYRDLDLAENARGVDAVVAARIEELRPAFADMATLVAPLDPAAVLLTEYFDPSRDEDGEFCSRAGLGILRDEAEFAFENVIAPLNRMVAEGVRASGGSDPERSWVLVDGIAEQFSGHGYCAQPSDQQWVVDASDSPLRQGELMGAFHPSDDGHRAIARRLYPALRDALQERR